MRYGAVGLLGLMALLAGSRLLPTAAQDLPGEFEWRTDLEAARAQAREEGRPLLIVFR